LLELKGFARIALAPGASGSVTMQLPAAALRFTGIGLERVFEAGEVEVLVGASADRAQLLGAIVHLTA
jgi:beta-glucosidase